MYHCYISDRKNVSRGLKKNVSRIMKFNESFCKLGAVPGLKKQRYFPLYYCFPKILWNANSFYRKGQTDGRICGGMWPMGVELDTA